MTRLLVLALAGLAEACSSPLSSAVRDFETGRPTAALSALESISREGVSEDPKLRARHALYRGLAYLTLGNAAAAESFLLSLKHSVEHDPELLSTPDRCRLVTALSAMGHVSGD